MSKRTILLLFGGESSEHEVSISSARNAYAAMDNEKYQVELCYIDKQGKWWLLEQWEDNLSTHGGTQVSVVPGAHSVITMPEGRAIEVSVVFPMLHGKNGEDGTVQGLASVAHIPMVGPSTVGAALTMDKDITKHLLRDSGVPVVDWLLWHAGDVAPEYDEVKKVLGETLFIKPANAGSSIGVSKVRSSDEYQKALGDAAMHDDKVLIEKAIVGTEVQVSMLGNQHPQISQICEIESVTDFHDFDDKYSQDSTAKFHIPARLSDIQTKRILAHAQSAYTATRGRGLARIDFFVVDEATEYLNEINSIPGFTNVSVYPRLWREAGMLYPELIDQLIDLAVE